MILVTLGTQHEQFNRLLDCIEKSKIDDKIIVQAGYTNYKSKKMKIFDFVSYDDMEKLIAKSDLIITHGGTGSIIMAISANKKVIACPRLSKYNEHINDHQKDIVNIFSNEKYLLAFNDGDNFDKIYQKALKFNPKRFISNTEKFVLKIKNEIDN